MLIGDRLLRLVEAADSRVILVAPFMKGHALERVLERMPKASELICVTRWRLEELAAGVSDLAVWPLLARRERSRLLLRHELHAKYYRAGARCLVGSANLTGAALGWSAETNLELLVELGAEDIQLAGWEENLFKGAIEADADLYAATLAALEALPVDARPCLVDEIEPLVVAALLRTDRGFAGWLPATRYPRDLLAVYRGSLDGVSRAGASAAAHDLAMLDLPAGLDGAVFQGAVAARLLQHPLVRRIDRFVAEPRRFGEVTDLLARHLPAHSGAELDAAWQTLMRWLLHFLPLRYSHARPRRSELFWRTTSNAAVEHDAQFGQGGGDAQ